MPSALVPIFFVSGIAGLTFETLWFRLAGLSLGNSIWSASLVHRTSRSSCRWDGSRSATMPARCRPSRARCPPRAAKSRWVA